MQRQRQQTTSRTITRGRDGNIKRVTAGENTFKFYNHKWHLTPTNKPKPKIEEYKERLRRHATPAERTIKKILRSVGISFHFQKLIKTDKGVRYGDFYIPGIDWIIELDGGYHNVPEQQVKDELRTQEIIKATGYTVVRFTNEQVSSEPDKIIDYILYAMKQKMLKMVGKE